jgi:hypothetical protein
MERPVALRSKLHLRPALAILAVPAAALLISASASAAPATPAATARAASTTPANFHTHPLQLLHGAKSAGPANSAASTPTSEPSSNWSGYVATGSTSTAGFRYVQATFTVPSVNCTTTPTAAVGAWVGLDGVPYGFVGESDTVEQDGIAAECDSGTPDYYAWYESYPADAVQASFTISPGDAIEASVYWNASAPASQRYDYQLTDVTTGASLNTLQPCGGACHISSAEVITEAPSDASGDVLPLADYGIVNYENLAVTDRSGQRAGFTSSDWKNTVVYQENASDQILSTPSSLFGGLAFMNDWERAS